jgi:hypothetical protein
MPIVELNYQINLPSEGVESTNHATSHLGGIPANLTLAKFIQLNPLSSFDKDSSFWVCDNSATGHICKDKSFFTGDLVPSMFVIGSPTRII